MLANEQRADRYEEGHDGAVWASCHQMVLKQMK